VIDAGRHILVVVTDVDQSHLRMKKKYLEGLNGSQVEKEIDRIVDRLELTIEIQFEADLAVSLENNLKCMQ
jgi:hypothetical protein